VVVVDAAVVVVDAAVVVVVGSVAGMVEVISGTANVSSVRPVVGAGKLPEDCGFAGNLSTVLCRVD